MPKSGVEAHADRRGERLALQIWPADRQVRRAGTFFKWQCEGRRAQCARRLLIVATSDGERIHAKDAEALLGQSGPLLDPFATSAGASRGAFPEIWKKVPRNCRFRIARHCQPE